MIISQEKNRAYNGMLNTLRTIMYPHIESKKFRTIAKEMNPNFPRIDGLEKSMADITDNEFELHLTFLKTMAIRRDVILESFSRSDIDRAKNAKISIDVSEDTEEDGDMIVVDVTCSNCGAKTVRGLTEDRYVELVNIVFGDGEESNKLEDSFMCLECTTRKSKEK